MNLAHRINATSVIHAPIDGVVADRQIEQGDDGKIWNRPWDGIARRWRQI
ncbi:MULTISPECIES: hypothetical protein [unclassified Lysobacter]|nr:MULTISPECIES: hypothetical protein [unclassified Lysobacter]MBT2747009.1 hypothetical protein [Lysobacter sp. ISL-42]MBT2750530.1 hypothetical protein [Lysobacter sp. ISL-50]MBT2776376.1 hypothetical protein [Lysobacter sp. ISL-54]MBT2780871.1 hypothetical protein [Lysobacter sp. ISL-52]